MRAALIFFSLLVGSLAVTRACLADVPPLRIGLYKNFGHATILLISSDKAYTLQDAATGQALAQAQPNCIFKVTPTAAGIKLTPTIANAADEEDGVVAVPADGGCLKIARPDAHSGGRTPHWRRYRGTLTLRREPDGTLEVINTVALESYLYGVIPAEIGADVPPEAMKAQAVAARTFALKNRGRFAAEGFDLDDTTKSEGYTGIDGETPNSNAAVDDTRGQVLTYQGQLIDAPYSTDSGGMTACDTSGACPYLQAVADAPPNGPDYAADDRYHAWTKTYTQAELAAALAADPRTQVNGIVSLSLDGFDASGRITTATVAGADGMMKTVTGPQLRAILGYDVLRSTRVRLTITPDGKYRFDGKGWGHGLGMSQLGAVAMASPPYRRTYRRILQHYYVGTVLTNVAALHDLDLAAERSPMRSTKRLSEAAN